MPGAFPRAQVQLARTDLSLRATFSVTGTTPFPTYPVDDTPSVSVGTPSSRCLPSMSQVTRSPDRSSVKVFDSTPIRWPSRRGTRCARSTFHSRPSLSSSCICVVQQVETKVKSGRPFRRPVMVRSHHENVPPKHVKGFGFVSSRGEADTAAQALDGEGTSPPAGSHDSENSARPTFGFTARMWTLVRA